MKSIAIICEYNLFHNGHMRQINIIRNKLKDSGHESTIISLMSGSFIQRGGPAVLPAYVRAEAAVRCGSDLVLELPYPWSGGSAEYFARGSVDILNSLGGVDYLCFGSESGNIDMLIRTADNTLSGEYTAAIDEAKKMRHSGITSDIILRNDVFYKVFGEELPVLPNDILGLEYLRALKLTGSKIEPFAVKREGNETATESRASFTAGKFERLQELIPPAAYDIFTQYQPTRFESLGCGILARLRLAENGELATFEGVTGGLDRRLCSCALKAATLNEFFLLCATKRYTNARLRRTMINCMLKTTGDHLKEHPCFTRLLAANSKGTAFLRDKSGIPVFSKPSHQKRYEDDAYLTAQIGRRQKAEALYSLARGESAEDDLRRSPLIINDK
jgi:predicted nucleotidyltransferase